MVCTDSEVSWKQAEIAVLLTDDAMATAMFGVGSGSDVIKAICAGIGNVVIRKAVTAATTYMYMRVTGSTTVGRATISAATICSHIDAGAGGVGEVGSGATGCGAGGGVINEVAMYLLSSFCVGQQSMLTATWR